MSSLDRKWLVALAIALAAPAVAQETTPSLLAAAEKEGKVVWYSSVDVKVAENIAKYAPNIRDIILHRQVLTPLDLEREWGLSEGNIFQGELTLEQLFFLRPAPGWAQYRTPVRSLYMCGSATHPGGGIMGAPGRNAAMRILAETRA